MKPSTLRFVILGAIFAMLLCFPVHAKSSAVAKPNVLVIYVDDVGYNDIGCYDAQDPAIETPNIDQMAKEGIRFTDWISASNTCAPSRGALLTGRYPTRNGVAAGQNSTGVFGDDHVLNSGLHVSEYTMAELLKDVGYNTAMYGKSHLGFAPSMFPLTFGFDEYYGSMSNFPIGGACPIWENDTMISRGEKFQDTHIELTNRSIAFMKKSKKEKKPFFIYLSHYLAHGPWDPNRQFATDEEWKIFQNQPIRGHLQNGGDRIYPALIREMDWHVGQVLAALKELELDENTIVFFISDNGPWLPAGSAWPLGGSKYNTFEGGHRVPAIVRWPGTIPGNQISDKLMSSMDVFPTVAKLSGGKVPDDRVIDGKDVRAVLMGDKDAKGHDVLYYYGGYLLEAVRENNWKLHLPRKKENKVYWSKGKKLGGILDLEKPLLFDLSSDPTEKKDVAAKHPEVVKRLLAHAEKARAELGDWNRIGSDQKPIRFKVANPNHPDHHTRDPNFWFDFLEKQGVEIPE